MRTVKHIGRFRRDYKREKSGRHARRLDAALQNGGKPMRYSSIALIAIALTLAGCVAQQQREAAQAGISCLSAVYQSPEAALLRARQPFNVNDATLAQLADSSVATPAEIASLSIVHPRLRLCQNEFLVKLDKLAPTIAPVFAKNYRDADDDIVALIQRRMTWGEFTRRRRDHALAGQESVMVEERRLAAESQARAQTFIERLAAASAVSAASQPVQPRATFTTCTRQGAFTNCIQQ